jgi:hypothetical protein
VVLFFCAELGGLEMGWAGGFVRHWGVLLWSLKLLGKTKRARDMI